MLPRECDGDDCDYETYVDSEGRPRARWEHVGECLRLPSEPVTVIEKNTLDYLESRY